MILSRRTKKSVFRAERERYYFSNNFYNFHTATDVSIMNKNLDKLKQFFRNSKTYNAQEQVWLLKPETERDLKKESPMEKRVKMLKELGDVVSTNRLEEVS